MFDKINCEKENLERDLFQSDQTNKKLMKETREIQSKHEKLCLVLINCKGQKEQLEKDLNKISVALESSKKAFKDSHKIFDQKVLNFEKRDHQAK